MINPPFEPVLVPMTKSFAKALLELRASFDKELWKAVNSVAAHRCSNNSGHEIAASDVQVQHASLLGMHTVEFLGTTLAAWTLPEVFSLAVDLTAYVAPEAVDKLTAMRARRRRFVAKNRENIHPGRPDLPVLQTKTGWWISRNIGRDDLERALRALADASGLTYGADVRFIRRQ